VFFLIDGLLLALFSLNISHIFFIIPNRYGLLVRNVGPAHSSDQINVKMTFIQGLNTGEAGIPTINGSDDSRSIDKN
jgi:hypothetical protein